MCVILWIVGDEYLFLYDFRRRFFDMSFQFFSLFFIARPLCIIDELFRMIFFFNSFCESDGVHSHIHFMQLTKQWCRRDNATTFDFMRHVKYLSDNFRRGKCIPIHLSRVWKKTQYKKEFLKCRIYWLNYWWLHFQLLRIVYRSATNTQ